MKHSRHKIGVNKKGVNKKGVNKKGGDIMHSLASVKGNNNLLLAEMDKFIDNSENPEDFFKLQKLAKESNKFISNLIEEVQEHETVFIDREDKLDKINSVMNDLLSKIEDKIRELREKDTDLNKNHIDKLTLLTLQLNKLRESIKKTIGGKTKKTNKNKKTKKSKKSKKNKKSTKKIRIR
jgi:hypothetical protein